MQLKALLLCALVAAALNVKLLAAADVVGVPRGWDVVGDAAKQYEIGYDAAEHATYMRAIAAHPSQAVSLVQALDPKAFVGHHVYISADVRDDDPAGRFEMYLHGTSTGRNGKHVDTLAVTTANAEPGVWEALSFDIELVDDDKDKLSKLALGFAFQGNGRVWARNVKISEVRPANLATRNIEPLSKSLPLPEFKHATTNLEMAQ